MILLGDQANSSQSRAHVSEEILARAVGAGRRAGPTPISPQVLQGCRQVGNLCTQAHTLIQTNAGSPSLRNIITHSSMQHIAEVQRVYRGTIQCQIWINKHIVIRVCISVAALRAVCGIQLLKMPIVPGRQALGQKCPAHLRTACPELARPTWCLHQSSSGPHQRQEPCS